MEASRATMFMIGAGQNINGKRLSTSWWWISAVLISLVLIAPLSVIAKSLISEPGEGWKLISELLLADYIRGTLIMIIGVGALTLIFGVGSAWIVTVWEFPGKKFFSLTLMLPMAIPTYVMAYGYAFVKYDIRDPLMILVREQWGAGVMSQSTEIFNYFLAISVLSFALYPYVYIAARIGFAEISGAYIENSRLLGRGLLRSMFSVGLPLARPAIVGGLLLALLEVVNEYGAMKYYGIETLTTGIFVSWADLGDKDSAIRLAGVAMVVVFIIIVVERTLRGRAKYHAHRASYGNLSGPTKTAVGSFVAFTLCAILLLLSFVIPILKLSLNAFYGWRKTDIWSLVSGPLSDSLLVSGIACCVIIVSALIITYAKRLFPSLLMKLLGKLCMLGYAVPGAVVAISILIYFSDIGKLIGASSNDISLTRIMFTLTPIGLIVAYAVRFMTPALAPIEAGMGRVSNSMDEASALLGRSSWGAFFRVHLPLLRLPLLGALIVLFVDVLKELPLTLVLRPPNVETLATTCYGLIQKEERIADGSLPALILVIAGTLGVLALHGLIRRRTVY